MSDDKKISIKVNGLDGSSTTFKLNIHQPIKNLFIAYCNRCNLDMRAVRFLLGNNLVAHSFRTLNWSFLLVLDGERIQIQPDEDVARDPITAATLQMSDGDIIEIDQKQEGGN